MHLIETESQTPDGGIRATFVSDEDVLEVNITPEGIILDAYADHGETLVGTSSMLASEWFDRLAEDREAPAWRVDVIFEGAVDSTENYHTFEYAEQMFEGMIQELASAHPHEEWQVDVYDETAEPPERVLHHPHEADEDDPEDDPDMAWNRKYGYFRRTPGDDA